MAILYSLEPLLFIFLLIAAEYPPEAVCPPNDLDIESQVQLSHSEDTALVIPCYKSADVIKNTLEAALNHFQPQQIYIIDNSDSSNPLDNTENIVKSINPEINYIYVPIGNKTIAMYAGAKLAKNYINIMTTDDDVTLPKNFICPKHLLNDQVKAVAFPIQAVNTQSKQPLFVAWQDIEYKCSDLAKLAEHAYCGVLFPHGAANFWDRETLLEIILKHDTVFYADDVKLGIGLQSLGKKMALDATVTINTCVPESLFGQSYNYYIQRVRSWEMGKHIITHLFIGRLFSFNGKFKLSSFLVQKLIQLFIVLTSIGDWIRVPLFVILGNNFSFWMKIIGFSMGPVIPLLFWKYGKLQNRPDLDPSLISILTIPIYKVLYNFTAVLGALRAIFIYWPNYTRTPTIIELERNNDPRCVWLKYFNKEEKKKEEKQVQFEWKNREKKKGILASYVSKLLLLEELEKQRINLKEKQNKLFSWSA